ncbi:MAG: C40 family peptidase [Candidatus Nanopelagicales bacterium]|nr:C40 family peptidase [Candidatus Nanopelagicales bacterium]
MRSAQTPRIRTAAAMTAGAVLLGGLPLLTATSAQAAPAPVTTTTAPAPVADTAVKTKTKKKTKAQKKREKRIRAKKRANRQRSSLVRVALNKRGKQYVAGAAGPNSFDCSGFTQYVYKKATGKYLPHYSGAQMNKARRVSKNNLKPGDLLFYGSNGSQHVSMYIGKGKMIHATNPRTDVRIDSVNNAYWRGRFAGAGRIINN